MASYNPNLLLRYSSSSSSSSILFSFSSQKTKITISLHPSSAPFPRTRRAVIALGLSSLSLFPPSLLSRAGTVLERRGSYDDAFSQRVQKAILWLEKGRAAQAQGDYEEALRWYTQIKETAGDLALAEYARVGRALSLYEIGDRGQAIIEMEDVSVSLKGYPEVHAALAAALYVDKHAIIPAEQQFTIATLLDPHYTELSYVRDVKHWPPSLVESWNKFINLK